MPAGICELWLASFGVGEFQGLLGGGVMKGYWMLAGLLWKAAVVGRISLGMYSTAMALQLLREKGMNRIASGPFVSSL
ncbi:hypothetical protein [Salmonella enterica]|uniref:hypothetical protein n=1 Tax=Salmonella enterica TaxID=28901 RepID=UPI00398C4617